MKAVILSGSPGTDQFPLANAHPKLLLPLANLPAVAYTLEALGQCGIREIAIVGSEQQHCNRDAIEGLREAASGTKVSYFAEAEPLGTAGALRGLRAVLGSSDFLVLGANVFCERRLLAAILAFHRAQTGPVTMVLEEVERGPESLENVEVSEDDEVVRTHSLHRSRDLRRALRPSGLYVFPARVLDHVPLFGHMDIKEQLIPALHRARIRVNAYCAPWPVKKIDTIGEFFQLNRELVARGGLRTASSEPLGACTAPTEGISIGNNVDLAPTARLIGPLVIGNDCAIGDHAELIGPTSIGDGSSIGEHAFVRESAVFANAAIGRAASVRYSVIAGASAVSAGEHIANAIVMNEASGPGIYSLSQRNGLRDQLPDHYATPFTTSQRRRLAGRAYLVPKRTLDVVASSIGLLVLLPLLPFAALAIRLDSRGPAIYRQTRCGKGGREFTMYKLRTMVEGAEQTQQQLAKHKHVDGPMFKMRDDPRITRVGRRLRKAGIDELPQLFNVLRGDMSLVGPRPLVMEEMHFAPGWRDVRLSVRPGITGLWQISDHDDVAFHSWITSDIEYVRRQSLALDLSILLRTALFSLRGSISQDSTPREGPDMRQ
jgi:lipopolysaccharide/colanic/teichoic acid biosynthesis glycosyltransferase/acetyltransferase-like isoleucine patch superfamily enzyme